MTSHGHTPEPVHAAIAARDPALGIILRFDSYELDFARRELRRAGALVAVQPTPLRVLLHLAEHRDRTVPRRELLDAIWADAVVGDEALTTALAEARHAVGDDGATQRVIRTLKGQGYRFVAAVSAADVMVAFARASTARRPRAWRLAAGAFLTLAAATLHPATDARVSSAFVPARVVLAVLPIANLSNDPREQALAEGLTEQLAHELTRSGYPVVACSAVERWTGRATDLGALGRELGVSHVIEGSVRREAERLRVAMRLVETSSGRQLWSDVYEEPAGDRFGIQDRVTTRVVSATYLHEHVRDVLAPAETTSARAREVTELSAEFRRLFFAGEWEASLNLAERALALVPRREPYLRCRGDTLAMVSISHANLYVFGSRALAEAGPEMLARARAAVSEAPESAYAHVALSRARLHHWRWEDAEREMRRSCELAPRKAHVDMGSSSIGLCGAIKAQICAALGCIDDQLAGARLFQSQFAADVGASGYWLAWALINNNRLEEAEAASARAGEVGPEAAPFLPSIQWRLDKREAAVASLARLYSAWGASDAARELDGRVNEDPEAAWRWIADRWRDGDIPARPNQHHFLSASFYVELGDLEAALAALERSVAEHEPAMEMYALDPILDPIRDTPRFRALIARMGLTAYHAKYLKRPGSTQPLASSSQGASTASSGRPR
jgi:TolB-like protein/DNA-binding winged helix-turn-helix (wHTH) protein